MKWEAGKGLNENSRGLEFRLEPAPLEGGTPNSFSLEAARQEGKYMTSMEMRVSVLRPSSLAQISNYECFPGGCKKPDVDRHLAPPLFRPMRLIQ